MSAPSRFLIADNFRFDVPSRELSRIQSDGSAMPVALGSRAADMLLLFLQLPGELVTKDEIMQAVWPGTTVDDSNLPVQIASVRRALDADRNGASAIQTVPGRGYRFTLPVRQDDKAAASPQPSPAPNPDLAGNEPSAPSHEAPVPSGLAAARADLQPAPGSPPAWLPKWVWMGAGAALLAGIALVLDREGFFAGHSSGDPASAMTEAQRLDRGRAFARIGDFDRAIADFDEAIRVDPWMAAAYLNRAPARRFEGDIEGAIADAGKVMELAPDEHRAYLERGNDYLAKGDYVRAIEDYNTAIRITPRSNESFFGRGLAYFFTGELTKAGADFQTSLRLYPPGPLPVLWLAVVQLRSKSSAPPAKAPSVANVGSWPAPVLRMMLGELSPAEALLAGDDTSPATRRGQVCQANFYAGELALAHNEGDEAVRLFRLAVADCPLEYFERLTAAAELRSRRIPK